MAMIIDKLLDGVYAKFTATLTASFNAMYMEEAKPGAAFDYIVMESDPTAIVDSYGNVTSADVLVTLKAICKGDGAGVSGYDLGKVKAAAICSAYDNVALTLTGATVIDIYRSMEPFPLRLENDKGVDVCQRRFVDAGRSGGARGESHAGLQGDQQAKG